MKNTKILILVLISTIIHLNVYSQTIKTDKHFSEIKKLNVSDSVKHIKLVELYNKQYNSDWEISIETAKNSVDLFKLINKEYTIYWYLQLGNIYFEQGLYILSLSAFQKALNIQENENLNTGYTLLEIAKIYYYQELFEKSIEIYFEGLKEFEKLAQSDKTASTLGIAKTYNKLGIVYELIEDFNKSIIYFNKALELRLKVNDKHGIIDSYTSLGFVYDIMGDFENAINFYSKGIELSNLTNNYHYYIDLLLFRSITYCKLKNYNNALNDIDKAKKYAQLNSKFELARIYYYFAQAYLFKKDYKNLLVSAEKAIQYSDEFNLHSVKSDTYLLLVDACKEKKDFEKAFFYLKELNTLNEKTGINKINILERSVELEQEKKLNIELINKNKELSYKSEIFLLSTLLAVLLVLFLIFIFLWIKRKNILIKRSQRYFKALFDNSPFGIAVLEKDGKIKDVNKSLLSIMGASSKEESLAIKNVNLSKKLVEVGFSSDLKHVVEKGNISKKEYNYTSEFGENNTLRVINVPLKNNHNDTELIYSIVENISEKKESEELILKLSEIVKQTTISVIVTDIEGIINYVNPYFTKQTGYSEKEVIGKKPNILKTDMTPPETYKQLWNTLKKNKIWRGEFVNKTKRGKVYWENAVISTLKDKFNNSIGYIGILEDISEKKINEELIVQNEKKLFELNKTKDKFFSIIAHDLKNPFGAIYSLTEMLYLNHKSLSESKKEEIFKLIFEGAKNTFDLLNNLLTWARSQQGKIKFKPKRTKLNNLIQDNVELISELANKKEINILFVPEGKLEIFVDVDMLNFILRNLLTNAVKFTKQKGNIKIYTISEKDNVSVFIEDNGIGMDENTLQSLFKIDQTVSSKGTNDEYGTGLGLILSKEFVNYHKGSILVKSELGKGSIFEIRLPI